MDAALPPFKPLRLRPPSVDVERRADGSILIRSRYLMAELERSVPHLLAKRAAEHPERNFLAQRTPAGPWRFLTYGEMKRRADAVAQALIHRGLGPGATLMILSGNGLEHAVMAMGALTAGVSVAPVSAAYSLFSRDFAKLRWVFELAEPRLLFVDHGPSFSGALRSLPLQGIEVVSAVGEPEGMAVTRYDELISTPVSGAVAERLESVDHDTVAKFLFTSGSTGQPKAVIQTHRMMMAVIAAGQGLRTDLDDPRPEPPESLEWMPWSHISAGNIGFNGSLFAGGTIYLDDGRPMPGRFDETIRNLREVSPRGFGSAPIAFSWLADAMERDPALRASFFRKLEVMGYGGAALSNDLYDRMQALAIAETGQRLPLTTMYGATETQGVTVVHWLTERAGLIGLPLPGIELKLVPCGEKLEVRVKGPTVTPGYHKRPDLTAAAFDEEGYYRLLDAARFLDEDRPEEGLVFDGRVTEDFKLSSGTWVSVGTVRTHLVGAASPWLQDAVICGQDRDYIAVLAWPNPTACRELSGSADPAAIVGSQAVREAVRRGVGEHNRTAPGSSTSVRRILLLAEPPSLDGGEITDKGYVNQRATQERRRALVEALYQAEPPAEVIEL